jgi:transcriptional regulator with XRE-family HTH domain
MKSYGYIIHQARKAKGLTLDQLASKIGSHKGYISGIENRKVNPPASKVTVKLAKVLGLDPKDLLRRSWVEKAPELIRGEIASLLFPAETDQVE